MRNFEEYKSRTRFGNLDGLRFFCILLVLWHHAQAVQTDIVALTRGFLGVDFFFVLSGFLITTLLLREAETYGSFSLRNFYLRRIIRILPIYYFVVTSVCVYYIVIKGRTDFLEVIPYYYLFLSNFLAEHIPILDPTWSLSVEEQFYMVWPLLLLLLPTRLIFPVGIAIIALNVAVIMGAFGAGVIETEHLRIALPNATYAPLFIGALLAYGLHHERSFAALDRILGGRWTAVIGAVGLLIMFEALPSDLRGLPNLALHLAMAGVLATLVLRENCVGHGFLQHPFVMRFGVVSYGIYLYHLLALDLVHRGMSVLGVSNSWLVFVLYSLVSYAIAELSFRTLEAYFQRFRPKRT